MIIVQKHRFILFFCIADTNKVADTFNSFNIDLVGRQLGECNENSNAFYSFAFTPFRLLILHGGFDKT